MVYLILGILLCLLAALGFSRWESAQRKQKIKAAFAGRESRSPYQFYEAYFKHQGIHFEVVDGVRQILQEQLNADMSCLTDSDDFSKNLRFFWDYDSMSEVEIVCALEKRFGITLSDVEAANAHTVGDIVELVWSKFTKTV